MDDEGEELHTGSFHAGSLPIDIVRRVPSFRVGGSSRIIIGPGFS